MKDNIIDQYGKFCVIRGQVDCCVFAQVASQVYMHSRAVDDAVMSFLWFQMRNQLENHMWENDNND